MAEFDRESMLEMFTHEMNQLVDQLEQTIIESESGFSSDLINEVFRIMHTIKGSAAMMLFDSIATATHAAEDLFYYLREENPTDMDYSELADYVLACMDFIKDELGKIERKVPADGDPSPVVKNITSFLARLKGGGKAATPVATDSRPAQESSAPKSADTDYPFSARKYKAKIRFDEEAKMENVRAFTVLNNIQEYATFISHEPADLVNAEGAIHYIRNNGFEVTFSSDSDYNTVFDAINRSLYIKDVHLEEFAPEINKADGLHHFYVYLKFDEGAQMENVRAYTVVHGLKGEAEYVLHIPENLMEEENAAVVRENGLKLEIVTHMTYDEINANLSQTIYLKDLIIKEQSSQDMTSPSAIEPKSASAQATVAEVQAEKKPEPTPVQTEKDDGPTAAQMAGDQGAAKKGTGQTSVISVNVNKLDQLFKLMGELVIAEAMVTQNPELAGLNLENFHKDARHLALIITDVKETVTAMRMVSLSQTFLKQNRTVRDMCKNLGKEAVLEIEGAETEVDKNIIEHIGDPLMHIVRNSLDHGIETPERRLAAGKPEKGTIRLEAKNSGSEVWIIISDDGAGLNRDRILEKAKNQGLLRKAETEYTDKEIFQFIFMPGFSTNEAVTTYSGRGVGMDVVNKNLEFIGGSVVVDSVPGEGSIFTLKIPLTLAIIKGMIIDIAGAKYTVPIASIRSSFRPNAEDIFLDPNGNEMITVMGTHYNVVRLHEFFNLQGDVRETAEGIMMIIENGDDAICLFVNDLIGEQQVVSKPIPKYIKKIMGISGCTLLGNGEISLIIDVPGLFDR